MLRSSAIVAVREVLQFTIVVYVQSAIREQKLLPGSNVRRDECMCMGNVKMIRMKYQNCTRVHLLPG